jgi:hypothetical protein
MMIDEPKLAIRRLCTYISFRELRQGKKKKEGGKKRRKKEQSILGAIPQFT